jgi:Na+/H+-dicarboxylate symporter
MIESTKFALFLGISWALIIAPGPDMFYVITREMAQEQSEKQFDPLIVEKFMEFIVIFDKHAK